MSRSRRSRTPKPPFEITIESMTPEIRGLGHKDGKVVFVDFALQGETALAETFKKNKKFEEAKALEIHNPHADRVEPPCEHFTVCGGCSLQHMDPAAQIAAKQQALLHHFETLAGIQPQSLLPPLTGPVLGYRHKARLGVRYVEKKEKVLVGFREKARSYLAELHSCKVLHPAVGGRLEQLGQLIMGMDARSSIPQIEVAIGDNRIVLVFRHLEILSEKDRAMLVQFSKDTELDILLQPAGPDSIHALWPEQPEPLFYELKQQQLRIEFEASDFTQVNPDINEKMVAQALHLLAPQADENILDLFSGLGNFTLPLARQATHVVGVEGAEVMVRKARHNAELNDIDNVEFHAADLSSPLPDFTWVKRNYDAILLDPPRSGAMEIMNHIGHFKAKRIVYVSCHPATLARDAARLVNEYGYKLSAAGVMDMFPHTAHVESIALFEK